jgi:lipopolysaccharide/colanic/teichoic acid biosynthesis glycosyltransferase
MSETSGGTQISMTSGAPGPPRGGRRVLVCTPFAPRLDARHGGKATAQLLLRLAERNEIGLHALRTTRGDRVDPAIAERCALVHEVVVPAAGSPLSRRLAWSVGLLRGLPPWAADCRSAEYSQALERLLDITDRRFHVVGLTSFYEYAFGCVPVSKMTPMWFMSLLHVRQRAPRRPSKRVFDVVVALLGLLILALLFPFFALAIKCSSPGPALYRQVRVGERGRRFTMYKLRTMCAWAEAETGAVFAQASDPRCTRIGRLMRNSHLDELPQLWNVLKGEMSIVGPRPERPEHIAMLEEHVPYWSRRLMLKPGLTGWAQVQSGYADDSTSAADKLAHDFWYMRHGNLAIDVAVCLQTVRLALEGLDPHPLWLRLVAHAGREQALR